MITPEQSQKFTRLHDRLTEVYNKKEMHRQSIYEFPKRIDEAMSEMKRALNKEQLYDKNNMAEKVFNDSRMQQLEAIMKDINAFIHKFQGYLKVAAEVTYKNLEDLMHEMITQHKVLSLPRTKPKEAFVILKMLQGKIFAEEKSIQLSIDTFYKYTDELKELQNRLRALHIYEDIDAVKFDLLYAYANNPADDAIRDITDKSHDKMQFFLTVYKSWYKELKEILSQLMLQQFREMAGNDHPLLEACMDDINGNAANNIILEMYRLTDDHDAGIDYAAKYENLESWRAFYGKPPQPDILSDDDRDDYAYLSEEEWQQLKTSENEKMLLYHNWAEKRKAAWYDVVQPLNFKNLPDLQNIEGDYWILYAVAMRDTYERWKSGAERIETVLDYEIDPAILLQPYQDLIDAISKKDLEARKKAEEKRDLLIYGNSKKTLSK